MAEVFLDQKVTYLCRGGEELRNALTVEEPHGTKGKVELSRRFIPRVLKGTVAFSIHASGGIGTYFNGLELEVKYVNDADVPITVIPPEYEKAKHDRKALRDLYTAGQDTDISICLENPGSKKHGTRREYRLDWVEAKIKKKKKKKKKAKEGGA